MYQGGYCSTGIMDMKFLTFNCRGLQDFVKRRKIFHYLRSLESDIIFLQETHSSKSDEVTWKQQWGERIWFSSHNSNSRGVAILIRNSVSFTFKSLYNDPNGRYLLLSASINDVPLILMNLYGPNNDDPDFFLEVFSKLDNFEYSSILCAGDFNVVLGPLDYQGTKERHSNVNASNMLLALIEEFNLCDIWRNFHQNVKQYSRHQKTPKVLSRLDFILVSDNFITNCLQSKIIPGIQSDHSAVILKFKGMHPVRGKSFWKLNCQYLHNDSNFIETIKHKIEEFKVIHSDSKCNANVLWDALKCTLTGTCLEYCARKKKEKNFAKNHLLKEIEEIDGKLKVDSDNEDLLVEKEFLTKALDDMLEVETRGLIVRSRIKWAEEGERSSKYFCNLEKRMGEKRTIFKLKDGDGNIYANQKKILEEIHSFYQNLYTENHCTDQNKTIEDFLNSIETPSVNEDDRHFLEKPFSKQELYTTICSMKHNKSPGFDGLPVEFYIVFWKDLSDMLLDSFNFSLQNGAMSSSQRNGVITLIPKKDKDILYLKNYRPISLLTVDYKILAKTIANRLKKCLDSLIHSDQSGFLKGRNIGNNVRLIIDMIEYTKSNDIPGAILLLDIQKAFDSVSHSFLFKVLSKFNFSENFISWIKVLYAERKSYLINYGNLTNQIDMQRGIFQGCPISPYLFLLVIECMALAIRQNPNIKGIPVENTDLKISLLADDSTCFIDGSENSFQSLFDTIEFFSESSGCRLNISKSEAIWIGSKEDLTSYPFASNGLKWNQHTFKTLGIHFSLNTADLYNLNHKLKLKSIETTLNCWRARNLSLVGKICVIKTLLLPQLLYFFSVLCIKIPKRFFKQLNSLLYKFIWNNGSDRVRRQFLCNDFSQGGLRMIDPYTFSLAQKMLWVKLLLDDKYQSLWKVIEISVQKRFSFKENLLWYANAPPCVLDKLSSSQLAESLQTWYLFREYFTKLEWDTPFSLIGNCQCIWYNKNVRSKSKQYFLYQNWLNNGIAFISDLLNPPLPGSMLFEELILEYDIDPQERRKYNFLMKNIPEDWLSYSEFTPDTIFEEIKRKLLASNKIPKYAYGVMLKTSLPEKQFEYWDNFSESDINDWEKIHLSNLKSTNITRIRSFYFKLFHRAIALNNFLYKIKRKDSPDCVFCSSSPETYIHLFVECPVIKPIWDEIIHVMSKKMNQVVNPSIFEKMFGCGKDKFVTFLFLLLKYYIYICKFQGKIPSFEGYKTYIVTHKNLEYAIAKKNNKLPLHFKKWRFKF